MTHEIKTSLSDLEWTTCWMSIRYAMGRQTIASSSLPAQLVNAYWYRWTDDQKKMILEDLDDYIKQWEVFGHKDIDNPKWMKFRDALDMQKHYVVTTTDNKDIVVFDSEGITYSLDKYVERPDQNWFIPKENILIKQFDSEGLDQFGYDKDGYDKDGFDREGYDEDGMHKDSPDRWKDSK